MSAADGERIAPVTYLFGATPTTEGARPSSSAPVSPAPLSPVPLSPVPSSPVPSSPESTSPVFVDLTEPDRDPGISPASPAEPRNRKGDFDRISNVSMYALARRGMSSHEMRGYLLGREFDADAVDAEVDRLEAVALLDDGALAETLVRTLRDRKGLGRSAVAAELRRRHVDVAAIEEALDSVQDDELLRAIEIAEKRAPQLRSLDATTAKRRLGAFLMRKGYSGSVVSTAVQRALEPSGPVFR